MITLKSKVASNVPIEAECITPGSFMGKSLREVQDSQIHCGNRERRLGDAFNVLVTPGREDEVTIEGDVPFLKHVGARMREGKITIRGNVGMHLGRDMDGGEISVFGNVGDWLGAQMRGGLIHIHGSAGNLVGSAYRGSKSGMKDGTILIEGDAGNEVGELMTGGTIAVKGEVGDFAGALMGGGLIACVGGFGERAGAGMTKGTILAIKSLSLLPTFLHTRAYSPDYLKPKLEELARYGFPFGPEQIDGLYDRYEGDLAEDGKGRILVWRGKGDGTT